MRVMILTIHSIFLTVLTGCAGVSNTGTTTHDIKKLSNTELCRKHISIFNTQTISDEVGNRSLTREKCESIVRSADENIRRTSGEQTSGNHGPRIVNSNSPSCNGITIESAGNALFRGAVEGMRVVVKNTSGKRKWIQADVKYTTDVRTYFQNSTESWWETTKPLLTREAGSFQFWIRTGARPGEHDLRMLEVRVIQCGT